MRHPETINFTSIEDIKNNWKTYKDILLQNGVLVFRNANLSLKEQKQIQNFLGTSLNCYPSETDQDNLHYIETHAELKKARKQDKTFQESKEEILLNWHIEHANFDNSMVLGVWNMEVFKTAKENGNTLFVDVTKLFNKLPLEEQYFLKKCTIEHPKGMLSNDSYLLKDNFFETNILFGSFVKEHWVTKENILRISFWVRQFLYKFEDRDPTEEEKLHFNTLFDYFWNEVKLNKDNWIIQEWQQGDLLIVDLQKMAHSVRGGFESEDRQLTGTFSHEKNVNIFPTIDLDLRRNIILK